MTTDEFAAYLERAVVAYAEDNIAVGRWPREGAVARARDDYAESLPQGLTTPGHELFTIVDGDVPVGMVWVAVERVHGRMGGFIYDLEIDDAHRRQGHAARALAAVEASLIGRGIDSLSLHVFAHNTGAQALYQSLGFHVTGHNMRKPLG